jgi:hypothetical protein
MDQHKHPRYRPGGFEQEYKAWYDKLHSSGEAFDAAGFAALARAQWSDRPELAEAFGRCTRHWPESELYSRMFSPLEYPKRWHYAGNLMLQHPTLGALVVDFVFDEAVPGGLSIGGIEYLDRVMGRPQQVSELQGWLLRLQAKRAAHENCN